MLACLAVCPQMLHRLAAALPDLEIRMSFLVGVNALQQPVSDGFAPAARGDCFRLAGMVDGSLVSGEWFLSAGGLRRQLQRCYQQRRHQANQNTNECWTCGHCFSLLFPRCELGAANAAPPTTQSLKPRA